MPWELGVPGAAEGPPAPFPPAPAVPPPLELSLLFWPVESSLALLLLLAYSFLRRCCFFPVIFWW